MIMHPKSKLCCKTHELVAAPELIFNKTKEDPATDFDFFFFSPAAEIQVWKAQLGESLQKQIQCGS
jgi:hypothetical protein